MQNTNTPPEKNPLLGLPKVEETKIDKLANNAVDAAIKREKAEKYSNAAGNKIINASMYDKKIEKLQSYGSKWNNYGYTPDENNEAFYDKMTSDTEQWGRSLLGGAKLAKIGLVDSALFGAFANSKKNANEFGKVADIYSTQRGGVTGFSQNLLLNSGYTFGIMADMIAEEAALAGITALTALPSGGTSLAAGGSAMIAKGLKAFGQIGKAYDKMNDIKRAINAVDKVKDLSNTAKVFNKIGKVLNPVEHTTNYIKALKNVSTVKDLTTLGKLGEGGAAIFRDIKSMQLAYSEAKLEANMLEKDMYDEYIKENPYLSDDDLKDLNERVSNAKLYTTWENTAAIFATNKLVFDNMYKRFDDLKGIGKFVSTGKFGKLAVSGGETAVIRSGNIFQKGFYQGIKDQSKLLFDKGALTALGRIGTSVGSKLGKYGVSNVGEGLQETLQETIQAKNKYQFGSEASGGYFDSMLHGLKEQYSQQGKETFLSGFLMGGMVHPITATVTKPYEFFKNKDYKQFTDKQTFNTERERKLSELKQDSDLINEGFKNVGNVYNSMGNTLAAQQRIEKEMVDAVAEGDRHLFQDKKDESFRTHLHTMMKHGMLDEFIKHTEGFKNMEPKQAAAAFGIDENTSPDVINKLINKKIEQAKSFKNRYTKFKQDFQSPVNVSKLKPTDDNYLEQINFHHHWNKAVDDMIFDTAEFEQNLDRKIELLDTVKNDAQQYGVSYTDYNVLTSDAEMNKEINSLNKEIAVLSGYDNLTSEGKEELKQKNYKLKALIKYQEALGEHNRVLSKIEELTSQPNLNKKQKSELKRLNAHLKRSADRMESRHGSYLKIVHTGEYETPGEKLTGLPKKTRLDHFSKRSFEKLYDYYKLDNRNKNLEQSIDLLSDPSYLQEHVNRMNKLSDVIMESHKAFVKNSISKFRDKEDTNKVIKELLDAGVSFDLSELDELIEKGIMPKAFYDIETEEELKQSDPKYKIAQQKLNNLIDNLIEQPILEREKDIYREVGRGVRINDGDKRTYNEIAKEYGFDVANERPVSEILDVIINSSSATKQEKELAKILKKLVPADSKVVFVDNSGRPNKFQNGKSIIDARYAASNFTNSVFSIEELILKNELERLTTDALKNDPVFNAEVKALKEATIEYVKEHNEKNKDDESKQIKTSWKAFDSELDFIKESFGNQSFQTLLTRVPAPKKETTTWQSLIDSMVEALNKLLGKSGNVSATVYNSIVSVVQAKIDPSTLETPQQDDSLVEQEEEITTTPTSEEVEELPVVDEDYADFDENKISTYPKVLLSKLIEGYRSDVEKGDALGKDANKLSETNLTKEFKSWVDDFGQSIIESYRTENEKPISDNIEVIDVDNKEVLIGRGFTEEQINAMSAAELEKAVKENTMPSEISSEELVVDELINEVTISEDEKVSEEKIPTDTTGEGASSAVSPTTTEEEVSKSLRESETTPESLRTDEESLRKMYFQNSRETGIHSPIYTFEKLAKEELDKEALSNKKLFRKVVEPTKEQIKNRAFELYKNVIRNVNQSNDLFEWQAFNGLGGFDSVSKNKSNTSKLEAVDVRNSPNLYNYTYGEGFTSKGIRFVDIKIPIQSKENNQTRPPVYVSFIVTVPNNMSASSVAEPIIAKAKEISANRSVINNPTTTKEMIDMASAMAESIIKNKTVQPKTESQTINANPESVGANTDVIVVEDQKERPDIFNEWTDPEVKSPSTTSKLVIAKKIQEIYDFGQELDNTNAKWSIGSFRAQVDGRLIVDVFANGKRFLVYKSIGQGTGIESKGEWTPIFGFADSGWFIKDNWKGKNPKFTKYESKTYMAIDQYLKTAEDTLFSGPKTESQTTVENKTQGDEKISESSIEAKRVAAQNKIKRTDLFDGVGEFSTELGGSDLAAVPVSHKEINGIEFVEYAHPKTGSVDVIVTGKSNNDFVGFYRIYENGKPTNKWSSKFENQSRNKEDFKTMISGVQDLLPIGHEYTEKTSISTDGLRVWNQQLNKGYELQYDEKGNIKTNRVAINGDAIVNELGIPVNKGNFENIRVLSEEQFNIVKEKLLPYLTSLGLTEKNIHWVTGTVKIDLPILKKSSSVSQKTTAEQISNAFEELAKSVGEGAANKMQQYADRIKAGEPKEKVLEGVSKSFVDGVNALLEEKTTTEQPVGRNQSMHEKLVSELESNKTVTGNIVAKGSGNKSFVLEINGEKAIFYDYNNEVSASDLNKKVTLKLVPELKVEGKAEPFKNVIQVYDGERFLGNVAITDYDTSEKITVPTEPTDEELQSIAEEIVDKNEEVFATPESVLAELGYTKSDINKLSKANKMRIIKDQISKEQFVKEQAELKKLKQENKIQGEITNFLSDKFTGIKTEKDLIALYDKLLTHLNEKNKVSLKEINDIHLPFIQNIFNQARLDLSNQKDFSTLSVGDKLLLTDGRIVKVKTVNQKTNTIEVVDFNSIIENKTKLTAKQFDTNVKKVINDFNLKQDEIASALDQNNLDDLSSILSKFTTQSFAIADEDVTDEDILEHFKACK